MFQEISTPVNRTIPVSSTISAEIPSIPSRSVIPLSPIGHGPGISSHFHIRSNCIPPTEWSYARKT